MSTKTETEARIAAEGEYYDDVLTLREVADFLCTQPLERRTRMRQAIEEVRAEEPFTAHPMFPDLEIIAEKGSQADRDVVKVLAAMLAQKIRNREGGGQ